MTWSHVEPADVLSGLRTFGALAPRRRIMVYQGEPVATLLDWARKELDRAEHPSASDDEQRQHASQAVSNAQKAIDGLFDAYLERDFLTVRLPPLATFKAKLELLKKRLGQSLPSRLIPAVVSRPRNKAEHERVSPTVEDAGVAVEVADIVVAAMTTASDPLLGPAIAGDFPSGFLWEPGRLGVWVNGFPPHFAWIWGCADRTPRAGIGTASAPDTAEVRFAELESFNEQEHLELLRIWDRLVSPSSMHWSMDETSLREWMRLAGLDQPKLGS